MEEMRDPDRDHSRARCAYISYSFKCLFTPIRSPHVFYTEHIASMLTLEHPVATLSPSGSYSTAETSHGAQIVDRIAHRANATQIDLLVRLRIIERLQGLSHPRAQYPQAEEAILPVLNWLASCFVCGSAARVVAVALSSQRGLVTAYIASHGDEATNQSALTEAVNVFKTALRNVLSDDRVTPELATKTFLRLLLGTAYPKIFRKIVLVGRSGGEPGETTYHFGTIVHAWLTYRSEGEMSRGFVSMALNPDPTSDASDSPRHATDYMIQSLLTVVHPKHRDSDGLTQEGRHMYLSYIITACTLLEKSTFFNDVVNDTAFRAALRITDSTYMLFEGLTCFSFSIQECFCRNSTVASPASQRTKAGPCNSRSTAYHTSSGYWGLVE